ncbi:hypothetical protein SS37A_34270 [Methylocystis iwaonis]|uniref:Uncharacterized protein n=1 Tax=Methylocystis iwaonis TaxID=2885079 RepID=A0ABN6VJN7_9HYPH|nr:hypothetical protein SS37A_34270 [Methylocystis iwaonis]
MGPCLSRWAEGPTGNPEPQKRWFCSGFPIARFASVENDTGPIKRILYESDSRLFASLGTSLPPGRLFALGERFMRAQDQSFAREIGAVLIAKGLALAFLYLAFFASAPSVPRAAAWLFGAP